MSDDELLDTYDEWGEPTGAATRGDVHRDGLWHRCFHLWVLSGDGVLLQRRGPGKAAFPGMLDASAAGHLGAGETVEEGVREAEEELGVAYPLEALVPLGVRRSVDRPAPGMVNRELQHVFLVLDPSPLESFTALEPGEVAGLVRLDLAAFSALVHGGRDAPGPWAAQAWDGRRTSPIEVRRDEVIPAAYLPALTIMCERLVAGERPLAI